MKNQPPKARYCAVQRTLCTSCVLYEGDSLQEARCALEGIKGRRSQGEIIDRLREQELKQESPGLN